MNIREVSALVSEADKAVSTLESYQNLQIQDKGNTILEKVCNYIHDALTDAHWIFRGASSFSSISLNSSGMLYVGNSSALSMMKPIAQIKKDGIRMISPMNDDEILTLVHNWERFKAELHKAITKSIEDKQIELNKRISHMAYMQRQCDEFNI